MAKINIDREKCKGCLLCVSFCPKGLIKAGKDLNKLGVNPAYFLENSECAGCAQCAVICPDCCITIT